MYITVCKYAFRSDSVIQLNALKYLFKADIDSVFERLQHETFYFLCWFL